MVNEDKKATANEKLNKTDQANTGNESENTSPIGNEAKENNSKTAGKGGQTAVLKFLGNSVWKDANGKAWKHDETVQMPVKEYEQRDDIKWMVEYGEISLVEV